MLLILAGVTINLIIGENGIIMKAKEAQREQAKAEELERLLMVIPEVAIKNKGEVDMDSYLDELVNKGIVNPDDIETNPDGSKEIITDNGYHATVIDKGNGEIEVIIGGKSDNVNLAPKILKVEAKPTTNTIEIKVEAKNTEGAKYTYYYKENGTSGDYIKVEESNSNIYTIKDVTQGKKYDVKVEVKNKKGTAVEEITVTIGSLPEGTISFGAVSWNASTHKATVTISTTSTGYTLQYATSSNGPWTEIANGGRTQEQSLNTTIYARLWDGTNATTYATTKITETTAPIVTVNTEEITKNSIKTVVTASDNESGIEEYQYYIKKQTDGSYPTNPNNQGTDTSYTFTGLEMGTSYNIKVIVKDFAKNETIKTMTVKTEEKKAIDDWEYNTTTTSGKITLTKYIGSNPEVIVPNTFEVNGKTYPTELGITTSEYDSTDKVNKNKGPFIDNKLITKVTFENNVTFQNNNMSKAFQSCSNLVQINKIPETVTNLDSAFGDCASFNSKLVITSKITSMEESFMGCQALTQAPDMSNATGITKLIRTFVGCTSLEVAPDLRNCKNLKKIGEYNSSFYIRKDGNYFLFKGAFKGCTALRETPLLPEGLEDMTLAFEGCTSLTRVNSLPNSVMYMFGTFLGCEKLENIPEFPTNVTNIEGTYKNCYSLRNIPARIPSKVNSMRACFYRDYKSSKNQYLEIGDSPSIIIDSAPTLYDDFVIGFKNNGDPVTFTMNYTTRCSNINAIVEHLKETKASSYQWIFEKGSLVN